MSAASSSSAKAASKERLLPPDEEAPRLPDETNANIDTSGITFESVDLEKQIPTESMEVDEESDDEPVERKPKFRKLNPGVANPSLRKQLRRIAVPQHRFTPLRNAWEDICLPLVEHMKLQEVRMNTKKRAVEVRMSKHTEDIGGFAKFFFTQE